MIKLIMTKTLIRNFIVISFISILISRLIPHPPNFTTAIAVAFYLPALFGLKYVLLTLTAFILSDLVIGIHKNYCLRLIGVMGSCLIFFIISNFGVWFLSNTYSSDLSGLITCYVMGLPFLQNSLFSSIAIAVFIEFLITMKSSKIYISKINKKFLY